MKTSRQKIKNINVEDIKPNPYQTRRNYNHLKLNSLASSIKEVGILTPLLLRTTTLGYEIISGNRRFRAALMAGLKTVPAIVLVAGDRQCAQLSLIENLQREDLTPFEEAETFYNLLSYHGVNKEDIVKTAAINGLYISEKLKLLKIIPEARFKIEESSADEESARELIKIHDKEEQLKAAELLIKENLSPEDVSLLAKQINRKMANGKKKLRYSNIPLCRNTVKKTVNILKDSGEKVEFTQNEDENYVEYTLKVRKQSVF